MKTFHIHYSDGSVFKIEAEFYNTTDDLFFFYADGVIIAAAPYSHVKAVTDEGVLHRI